MSASSSKVTPILQLRDTRVAYGAIEAVRGISLELAPGELVSLIGANGAGKTTTSTPSPAPWAPPAGRSSTRGKPSTRCRPTSACARAWPWCRRGGASSPA